MKLDRKLSHFEYTIFYAKALSLCYTCVPYPHFSLRSPPGDSGLVVGAPLAVTFNVRALGLIFIWVIVVASSCAVYSNADGTRRANS